MTSLLPLLLAALPASAAFTPYAPDNDRSALRDQSGACHKDASRAAGAALELEKVPQIKTLIDQSVSEADAASRLCLGLSEGAELPLRELEAALKGKAGALGALKEYDEAFAAARTRRARWERLSRQLAEGRERASPRKEKEPKKKEDKGPPPQELLEQAARHSEKADWALRKAEEELKELEEQLGVMKDALKRAAEQRAELGKAASSAALGFPALRQAGLAAKAALDDLGREPQSVSKTRAMQKLSPLSDAAWALANAAELVYGRSDDFRRSQARFIKAHRGFQEAREKAERQGAEAQERLEAAEKLLAELRARP